MTMRIEGIVDQHPIDEALGLKTLTFKIENHIFDNLAAICVIEGIIVPAALREALDDWIYKKMSSYTQAQAYSIKEEE